MRNGICLFIVFFGAFCAIAQERTNRNALLQIASNQRQLSVERARRIAEAEALGVPRIVRLGENKVAVLMDHVDGVPYYVSTHNLQARKTTGVEITQSNHPEIPLEGEGMTIGVWDGGLVRATHVEFAGGRVSNKYGTSVSNHATHVTGTIAAAGVNAQAKGMLPKVKIISYYGFDDDLGQMADEAANGLILSNHSYGLLLGWEFENGNWKWYGGSNDVDARFGHYSSESRSIDNIAYNAPYYTMVWSAGNDRSDTGNGDRPPDGPFDCLGPSAVAKNVLTIGAITGFPQYNGPSSAVMSSFSSWGPTNDGRIKPDLVADGVGVLSTSSSGDEAYTTLQGTSMAAPNVTGSLGLLQQYYRYLTDTFMTAAGLKALAIHTAREAGNGTGPDYRFGWGVLNVEAGFDVLHGRNERDTIFVQEVLSNGAANEYYLLSDGRAPITATIVWTDVPGTPSANLNSTQPLLVNDLDIIIEGPNGQSMRPWMLDPATPNAGAKRGDNKLDNVEKIEWPNPAPGLYTLRVTHKGTLVNDAQAYGLIFTGSAVPADADPIYWVAGTGATSDDHWSEISGGGANSTIQPSGRTWVFDDNGSLANDDVITLSQNTTIENFLWTSTKNAVIELNGDTLFVEREFLITNDNLKIKNGVVVLNAIGTPNLKLSFDGTEGCTVIVDNSDSIEVAGPVNLHSLVMRGPFVINSQSLKLAKLTFENGSDVSVRGSSIEIAQALINRSQALDLSGNTWSIKGATVDTNVPLESNDTASFEGMGIVNGSYTFSSLTLGGELEWNGILDSKSLTILAGSSILGDENSRITVRELFEIQSQSDAVTTLAGLSSASPIVLEIIPRQILCADDLLLENLLVETDGVFNAGPNSTVVNTEGVLAINCAEIVFPDFIPETFCANSVIKLKNISTGAIDEYEWHTDGGVINEDDIHLEEPTVIFDSPGTYAITLTVRNEVAEVSFQKEIEITDNTIGTIEILSLEQGLVASINAPNLTWYLDGKVIPEAKGRIWAPKASGVYRVAYKPSSASDCGNRISTPFEYELVSSIEDNVFAAQGPLEIYPNPASDVINVYNTRTGDRIVLSDITGRSVFSVVSSGVTPSEQIDVRFLNPGIYILKVSRGLNVHAVKLIKK